MRTVEMNVHPSELRGVMAEMRIWFDDRGCEPRAFICRVAGGDLVIRVDFTEPTVAEAFAGHFSGRIGSPPTPSENGNRRRDLASLLPPEGFVG